MAPSAIPVDSHAPPPGYTKKEDPHRVGLVSTGSLDHFVFDDVTPAIGTEYPDANIVDDLLNAPNADQLIRDLAIKSESCTSKSGGYVDAC